MIKDKYPLCKHLPKHIIGTMSNQIKDSEIDEKERGFLICTGAKNPKNINDKNTIINEECIGGICGIEISGKCPDDKPIKGFFHTHPSGITLPTRDDIEYSTLKDFKFLCIGGDNEIRCMSSKIPLDIIPTSELETEKFEEYKKKMIDCIIEINE